MINDHISPDRQLKVVPSATAEVRENDYRFVRRVHEREDEFDWVKVSTESAHEERKQGWRWRYAGWAIVVLLIAIVLAGMQF